MVCYESTEAYVGLCPIVSSAKKDSNKRAPPPPSISCPHHTLTHAIPPCELCVHLDLRTSYPPYHTSRHSARTPVRVLFCVRATRRRTPQNQTQVRAKIEGLEALLPGMDGLAVVSSRPHLLGFSVRRNVSLKVSGLRALMKHQGQGPEQSQSRQWQGRGLEGQQQQQQLVQNSAAVRTISSLFRFCSHSGGNKSTTNTAVCA